MAHATGTHAPKVDKATFRIWRGNASGGALKPPETSGFPGRI